MPKFEKFKLHFKDEECFDDCRVDLKLKSKSLKGVTVQICLFSKLELYCPYLETVHGRKMSPAQI